jgi:hypothetical protein
MPVATGFLKSMRAIACPTKMKAFMASKSKVRHAMWRGRTPLMFSANMPSVCASQKNR